MKEKLNNKLFHFTLKIEVNNHKKEKVLLDGMLKYSARTDRRDRITITTNQIEIVGDRNDEKSLDLDKNNKETTLFNELKRCLLYLYFQNCEIKDNGKLRLYYEKGAINKEPINRKVSELIDLSCFKNKQPFIINNPERLFTCKQFEGLFCTLMHCVLASKENEGKLNEWWKALNALYKTKDKQSTDANGIENILNYIDGNKDDFRVFCSFCEKNIKKYREVVDVEYYLSKKESIQIFSKYTVRNKKSFSQSRLNVINKLVKRFQDVELLNNIKKCIITNKKYLYDPNDTKCEETFSSIIKTIDRTTKKDNFAFGEFFLEYIYQKRCVMFHGDSIDYNFFINDEDTENENKLFNQYLLKLIADLLNSDYLEDSINTDLLIEIKK